MALAGLRDMVMASPWAALLAPQGKLSQQGARPGPPRTRDEQVQATLMALMARAEGREPDHVSSRRAMCFSTALEMKQRGNGAFKQRAYADAASAYELGLDALEALARIDVDDVSSLHSKHSWQPAPLRSASPCPPFLLMEGVAGSQQLSVRPPFPLANAAYRARTGGG